MGEYVRFLTTIWTSIERAKRGDRDSIDDLIKQYSEPLHAFIRNRGFDPTNSEDILQEVLIRISDEEFLRKADKLKGKFRSILLGVTNNVILKYFERKRALKRGGDARTISLDELCHEESAENLLPAREREDFNRQWFEHVLRLALHKLQEESAAAGKPYYDIVQMRIRDLSYKEIADRLRMTEREVSNLLHYAKKKVNQYARELIAGYASTRAEFDTEVGLFVQTMQEEPEGSPPPPNKASK